MTRTATHATRDLTEGEHALAEELITAVHKAVCDVFEKVIEDPPPDIGRGTIGLLAVQALAALLGMHRARCLEGGAAPATCDLAYAEQMVRAFDVEIETHLRECGSTACLTPARFMVEQKRYLRETLKLRRRVRGAAVPIIP